MDTLGMVLGLAVILAGFVLGTLALISLFGGDVRRLVRLTRGVATHVHCPHSGRRTGVRIGTTGYDPHQRIFSCERFGDGEVLCGAECVQWSIDQMPKRSGRRDINTVPGAAHTPHRAPSYHVIM